MPKNGQNRTLQKQASASQNRVNATEHVPELTPADVDVIQTEIDNANADIQAATEFANDVKHGKAARKHARRRANNLRVAVLNLITRVNALRELVVQPPAPAQRDESTTPVSSRPVTYSREKAIISSDPADVLSDIKVKSRFTIGRALEVMKQLDDRFWDVYVGQESVEGPTIFFRKRGDAGSPPPASELEPLKGGHWILKKNDEEKRWFVDKNGVAVTLDTTGISKDDAKRRIMF